MALTVNTNIASLTAQRNLTGSQSDLSTSLERLSSGLRINSAKDDAAGLAISERFTAQIQGLNQGVRNANDGISLAQTAEGALKEVTSNLQRIRELSVQAANATNSASDRTALQAEVTQLVAEVERVASSTKFNGVALLDGTFTNKAFQVGADITDTVSISTITSAKTSALGSAAYASVTDTGSAAVDSNKISSTNALFINGFQVGDSASDSAKDKAAAINAISGATNVTATASATSAATATFDGSGDGTDSVTINGIQIDYDGSVDAATSSAAFKTAFDAAVAANSALTGLTSANVANVVTITGSAGEDIKISAQDGQTALFTIADTKGSLTLASTDKAGITVSSTSGGASGSNAVSGFVTNTATAGGAATGGLNTALSAVNISTANGATAAISAIDGALDTINSTRATLGSYQSRFDSIVASSLTTAENLSASRSRIMDADFAQETAQLTKSQILQQSGIAMLAQANSIPQNVLALLQ